MRIIQVTDTHLSPGEAHFYDNWAPLARWIASHRRDLIIHSGDLTGDGAEIDEDLAYAVDLRAWQGTGACFPAITMWARLATIFSRSTIRGCGAGEPGSEPIGGSRIWPAGA